jgi:MFS family permease
MPENIQPPIEFNYSKRQMVFGVISIFAVYGVMSYFVQSLTIARPKMAAELNGMSLYAWAVSLPSLVGAFATLIFGKFSDMYGRRIMLLITLSIAFVGAILSASSPSFKFLIVVSAISAIGTGAMMPLVFAVVGDLFPPAKRGMWIGMLNIPTLVCSLFGPTVGGWFAGGHSFSDLLLSMHVSEGKVIHISQTLGAWFSNNRSWRDLYWMSIPLLVICLIAVPVGVPSIRSKVRGKIDVIGCLLVAVASSCTILGLSNADKYSWGSKQVVGLLAVALVFWVLFITAEIKVKDPILDPLVFKNRAFLTVALAGLLSFFGQMGMLMYFPQFLQGVQGVSIAHSGLIITPMSALMSLIGVPVGWLLTRSKRFKWLYVLGYGLCTLAMLGVTFLTEASPVWLGAMAAALAGIGMGAIPTVNTMVLQNVMPKRLLGVAMGAFFFSITMGVAISPAVLGTAMNSTYNKTIKEAVPAQLKAEANMTSLGNPRVLWEKKDMDSFKQSFEKKGMPDLFPQTISAIRTSLAAGVRSVFWVSTITMLLGFLLICTMPKNSLEAEASPDAE